jgi:hypothetical protein
LGDLLNDLDLYSKVGFGLVYRFYNDYDWDPDLGDYVETTRFSIGPDFNFSFGGRYYLSDNFAIFGEVGGGFYSYTQFGITLKLK